MSIEYILGVDIGSTTVKYILCDKDFNIYAKAYTPHHTKQAQTLLNLLQKLEKNSPNLYNNITKVYITGSGASRIAPTINARFIQEVNAVVLAVEHLHPDVNSVIELGGQDAKIIHFKEQDSGKKSVLTSMNDKCASGTGATIEKCSIKVGLDTKELQQLSFDSNKLHHVATKCGVFAETDIVNLIKSSIPANEIMNSLADAIVMQNLTVLTRGNTLMPKVLLLGGPNTFLPFLQECWRERITQLWDEREIPYNRDNIKNLISVPNNAQYYGALGAIIFGEGEATHRDSFNGILKLKTLIYSGGIGDSSRNDTPLIKSQKELEEFKRKYTIQKFIPPTLTQKTECYLGIDGGSTSSKAVLIDRDQNLLLKVYQLSKGNPIQDTIELLEQIKKADPNNFYDIKGLGVTGYASDVLESALGADINIIETIAHMKSATKLFGDNINVICDVGGQDIKVLFMENGMMKNFRLSNQCSAGNGALLQSMAKQFGVDIKEFATIAFKATKAPKFNYGCAVFLDSDRVNFQKEGYSKEELFAGIAKVLPKNIWQYVVQSSNLSAFGDTFVLQGGTQYNQAALKAQVDYIKQHVTNAKIFVHPHCGEAGAYGVAIEAMQKVKEKGYSSFVGLKEAMMLSFSSKTDKSTRCHFCSIGCSRTFIDTKTPSSPTTRYIAGFGCLKGTVESPQALKELKAKRKKLEQKIPNLIKEETKALFSSNYILEQHPIEITKQKVINTLNGWGPTFRKKITRKFRSSNNQNREHRQNLHIAIPKVLNIYSVAPFLRTYLEALDIKPKNIIFSDFTNEDMYLEGSKYGSVDACFPAKVAQAHIYSLMFSKKFSKKILDYIWFPAIIDMQNFVQYTMGNSSCPVVSGTPRVVYSAFTKEVNLFQKRDIEYIDNSLNFDNQELLKKQLFNTWHQKLQITEDENNWAVSQALKALNLYYTKSMQRGKEILEYAQKNNEVVLLLLGRPYHADSGINHEILEEFQSLGFKSISINSIPKDKTYLNRYFKEDIEKGYIKNCFDIRDVWSENFSVNSAQKVWGAKFASRHPNIAVIDLSSFKCGHDAPTYAIIDRILGSSHTPHLTLHDIDANKPSGSIKIRVKTFAYSLQEYYKKLQK